MLLLTSLIFGLVTFGLAWPLASRLRLEPAEKLCATVVLSLLGAYLLTFGVYVTGRPVSPWLLPVLAIFGLVTGRRSLVEMLRDSEVRALLGGQLLVSAWCIGWLMTIVSYSGGGWAGDWYEHWERTLFFLDRWPVDAQFLHMYSLPARPPLANVVTSALLAPAGATFAGYQLVMTLLNSLAFLPAALLARRFSGGVAAVAVLAVLLMVNPSFVENATFAWTKLITVMFVLSGLYFFLRFQDVASPASEATLCAASLGAGFLAHYSAGPYVLLLAIAWCALGRWREPAFWRQTAWAALVGAAILATWFAWSFATYGMHATIYANSSVAAPEAQAGNQWLKIALNLRDTIIPHFLRTMDTTLIVQRSEWGFWRDWFFQTYQLNIVLMFGSVSWLALLVALRLSWKTTTPARRAFWLFLVIGAVVVGVAVHGARDTWGLAQICLQSLLVLGLAVLAVRWSDLGRGWRLAIMMGAVVDFALGIALQAGVQSYAFDWWFSPSPPTAQTLLGYSASTVMNLRGKLQLAFLGDAPGLPGALVLALLALILTLALVRASRAVRPPV